MVNKSFDLARITTFILWETLALVLLYLPLKMAAALLNPLTAIDYRVEG